MLETRTFIPYSSLLPRNIEGLIVAGRCMSADREALGSVRVGATCAATGHASGVAGALAAANDVQVRDVPISDLQSELRAQNAIVSAKDVE